MEKTLWNRKDVGHHVSHLLGSSCLSNCIINIHGRTTEKSETIISSSLSSGPLRHFINKAQLGVLLGLMEKHDWPFSLVAVYSQNNCMRGPCPLES